MNFHDPTEIERLTLKLAINRYLRKWLKQHASQVVQDLRGAALEKPDLFSSVVAEMEAEGLLTRETGKKGGLILVYRTISQEEGIRLCQKS